jgi:hypothetical protein
MRSVIAPLLAVLLLVAACAAADGPAATSPTPGLVPETPAAGTPAAPGTAPPATVPPDTVPPDEALDRMQQVAISDLAGRLNARPEDIETVTAEQVTWPDGSLGCPQPDMGYTQALVEGYRVILRHEGRIYLYHAAADAVPFLCASDERDGGYDFVPPPGFEE